MILRSWPYLLFSVFLLIKKSSQITPASFGFPTTTQLSDIWTSTPDPQYSSISTYQDVVDDYASKVQNLMVEYETTFNKFESSIETISEEDRMIQQTNRAIDDLVLACDKLNIINRMIHCEEEFSLILNGETRKIPSDPCKRFYYKTGPLVFNFYNLTGYNYAGDKKHSCIFTHNQCKEPFMDCPDPINKNHERIYKAFKRHSWAIRSNSTQLSTQGIRSMHFTTTGGVTVLNPAQKIKYGDFRNERWFRSSLNDEKGVDVVFFIDKSISMTFENRHNRAVHAVENTIKQLSIEDRFTVIAYSKITSYPDCTPTKIRNDIKNYEFWSFNGSFNQTRAELSPDEGQGSTSGYNHNYENEQDSPRKLEDYVCMQDSLSYANKKIKDKAWFLLSRNLLRDTGSCKEWFIGGKDFVAGIQKMDEIFAESNKNGGSSRKKFIVWVTDGEHILPHEETEVLQKFGNMQKINNYNIMTSIYSLGKRYDLLDKLANQEYRGWHGNQKKQVGKSVVVNTNIFHAALEDHMKIFYFREKMPENFQISTHKWTWQNPPNFLNRGPAVTLSKALVDDVGVPIGVLAFDIDVEYLFKEIEKNLIDSSSVFVIRKYSNYLLKHSAVDTLPYDTKIRLSAEWKNVKENGFVNVDQRFLNRIDNQVPYNIVEDNSELDDIIADLSLSNTKTGPRQYFCSAAHDIFIICLKRKTAEVSTSVNAYIPAGKSSAPDVPNGNLVIPDSMINSFFYQELDMDNENVTDPDTGEMQKTVEIFNDIPIKERLDFLFDNDAMKPCKYFNRFSVEINDGVAPPTALGNVVLKKHRFLKYYFETDQIDFACPVNEFLKYDAMRATVITEVDRQRICLQYINYNWIYAWTNYFKNNDAESLANTTLIPDFPINSFKALKKLDKANFITSKPADLSVPVWRQFYSTDGLVYNYPASFVKDTHLQKNNDFFGTEQYESYIYTPAMDRAGLGFSIKVANRAIVDNNFVGNFVNTFVWSEFNTFIHNNFGSECGDDDSAQGIFEGNLLSRKKRTTCLIFNENGGMIYWSKYRAVLDRCGLNNC